MAVWMVDHHLKRMPDLDDKLLILQIVSDLVPKKRLFDILYKDARGIFLSFSELSDQEMFFGVLEHHGGKEERPKIDELRRTL